MSIDLKPAGRKPIDLLNYSKQDIYSLDTKDVEQYQLWMISNRFSELKDRVSFLRELADEQSISEITSWDDVAKLLVDPGSLYKSYSLDWIEEGRFDLMTEWINQYTSADLSRIDASRCTRIAQWCELLEEHASVLVRHSSGTSGTLTFMPRLVGEEEPIPASWMWQLQGWGEDPNLELEKGKKDQLSVFYPHARRMCRPQSAIFDYFEQWYTSKPVRTVIDYHSPDLARYAGIKRKYLETGADLESLLESNPLYRELDKEQTLFEAEFGKGYQAWTEDLLSNYFGERIMLFTLTEMVYDMVQTLKSRGASNAFQSNSVVICAGGLKTRDSLPDGWKAEACEVLGISPGCFKTQYGMTEMMPQSFQCSAGHYHFDPWMVPLLLDLETDKPLPREGVQTGQIALFDLFAESYWSGLISGDRGTVNYQDTCSCGRPGPHMIGEVERI